VAASRIQPRPSLRAKPRKIELLGEVFPSIACNGGPANLGIGPTLGKSVRASWLKDGNK
jgi:hypothetical protein